MNVCFPIKIHLSPQARITAEDMQEQDNSTPSSFTSVVTQSYDSSLIVNRVQKLVPLSPPSPVPRRRLHQGHAHQTTRNHAIADSQRQFLKYFPRSLDEVFKFATRQNTTIAYLKGAAKQLGLRIIRGNRRCRVGNIPDRISFGVKTGVIKCLKVLNVVVQKSLFNFGMRVKTGFVQPSDVNKRNFNLYCQYRNAFCKTLATVNVVKCNQPAQRWSPLNVDILIKHRCKPNPTCFATIASQLNELEGRSPSVMRGRIYTARDCQNKWSSLFPSAEDMYATLKYMNKFKQMWPGSYVKVEHTNKAIGDAAVITALHIVFPWTLSTMKYLSKTIFCDATFHVTVYEYKVVDLTTLDGNHQHRATIDDVIYH